MSSPQTPTTPADAYVVAKGYAQAAKMVWLSPHRTGANVLTVFLPMHLLIGFATELYLKAWLLDAGKTEQELRANGVRHSLSVLLAEAKASGLPSMPDLDQLIGKLHGPHEAFEYRYFRSSMQFDGTVLPSGFEILDQLDIVIDTKLGISATHGLQPGH